MHQLCAPFAFTSREVAEKWVVSKWEAHEVLGAKPYPFRLLVVEQTEEGGIDLLKEEK